MGKVYIGTSGYNYKHWKEIFYPLGVPQREWLTYFAQQFDTIEINATFYRHFSRLVFEKWRISTPEGFVFSIKGPRLITHVRRLHNVEDELKRFFESVTGLEKKLAVILWQFPYSFYNTELNKKRLDEFIRLLPSDTAYALEMRHNSWFKDEFFDYLNKNRISFVANDTTAFPTIQKVTGPVAYIRFHGPGRLYASGYGEKQLRFWAEKIGEYRKNRVVYCYFNNDAEGYALKNALDLRKLIV